MDMIIRRTRISDEAPLQDIGISDGRIVAIEQAIEQRADQEIDAEGRVALPGFIEPHLHLEKAFLHRRLPPRFGTLDEAIRLTGILKSKQEKQDVLDRSRQVLDMAVKNGTVFVRAHPDVDPIQGLIGVETALLLKDEYRDLLDSADRCISPGRLAEDLGRPGIDGTGARAWAPTSSEAARTTNSAGTTPAATSTRFSSLRRNAISPSTCMSTSPTIPRIAVSPRRNISRARPSRPAIAAASRSATSRASGR